MTFDALEVFTITDDAGREYVVEILPDDDMGPPWEEHDGHGDVSDWTTRQKRPGELVLNRDRGSYRYYDFAGAVEIAKREGWAANTVDAELARLGSITKGEKAERAARADFERLRAWCNDEWSWIGVSVRRADAPCPHRADRASVWGIESDAGDYLREAANDLVNELPTP